MNVQAPPPNVYESLDHYRQQANDLSADILNPIYTQFRGIESRAMARLDELNSMVAAARAQGVDPTRHWLYQQERYNLLVDQIRTDLNDVSIMLSGGLPSTQRLAIEMGSEMVNAAASGQLPVALTSSFSTFPTRTAQQLVMMTQPGPIRDVLEKYAPAGAQLAADHLVQGVSLGHHPSRIARQLRTDLGVSAMRATTIARTETMRAFRESSRLNMMANADILEGWVWSSARTKNTCAVCWSMHGRLFQFGARMTPPTPWAWPAKTAPLPVQNWSMLERGSAAFKRAGGTVKQYGQSDADVIKQVIGEIEGVAKDRGLVYMSDDPDLAMAWEGLAAPQILVARTKDGRLAGVLGYATDPNRKMVTIGTVGSTGVPGAFGSGTALVSEVVRDAAERGYGIRGFPLDDRAARFWASMGATQPGPDPDYGGYPDVFVVPPADVAKASGMLPVDFIKTQTLPNEEEALNGGVMQWVMGGTAGTGDIQRAAARGFTGDWKYEAMAVAKAVGEGELAPPLYRGIAVDAQAYDELRALEAGTRMDMNLSAWSPSRAVAEDYAAPTPSKPGRVVYELYPGAKGLKLEADDAELGVPEEWITDGRMIVIGTRVDEDGTLVVGLGQHRVYDSPDDFEMAGFGQPKPGAKPVPGQAIVQMPPDPDLLRDTIAPMSAAGRQRFIAEAASMGIAEAVGEFTKDTWKKIYGRTVGPAMDDVFDALGGGTIGVLEDVWIDHDNDLVTMLGEELGDIARDIIQRWLDRGKRSRQTRPTPRPPVPPRRLSPPGAKGPQRQGPQGPISVKEAADRGLLPMYTHPNCRCVMLPRARSYADLLGDPTLKDGRPALVSGADAFAKLPADQQRRILGNGRYALYKQGMPLGGMVSERTHPVWGLNRGMIPLRDLRLYQQNPLLRYAKDAGTGMPAEREKQMRATLKRLQKEWPTIDALVGSFPAGYAPPEAVAAWSSFEATRKQMYDRGISEEEAIQQWRLRGFPELTPAMFNKYEGSMKTNPDATWGWEEADRMVREGWWTNRDTFVHEWGHAVMYEMQYDAGMHDQIENFLFRHGPPSMYGREGGDTEAFAEWFALFEGGKPQGPIGVLTENALQKAWLDWKELMAEAKRRLASNGWSQIEAGLARP